MTRCGQQELVRGRAGGGPPAPGPIPGAAGARRPRRAGLSNGLFLGFAIAWAAAAARADLDAYLKRPEPQGRWEKAAETNLKDVRFTTLRLTSQVWRGIPWKHTVRVFRPQTLLSPTLAVLSVTGGGGEDNEALANAARSCGVAVCILSDIPNQPLFGDKREDNLIAYTFEQYVQTGEDDWPLLFPMTKAAVKAMDAIQELSRKEWGAGITQFVVTGASKRGWTSWLAAAADPRVAGVIPMVYDNLNLAAQMKNQLASWGAYSDRIADYTRRNLQALLETERGRVLGGMVDPYAFRDRLARIPKLIVNGTNDPYWPLDSLNLYWDGLEGQKDVLYVPNGTHGSGGDARVADARLAFVRRLAAGSSLPPLRWQHGGANGALTLRMTCAETPVEARLWVARAATRDFRKAAWASTPAAKDGDGFTGKADPPASGFLALFGEAVFKDGDRSFSLSTAVRIVSAN